MLTVTANSKINLTLDVLGKRDDNYHDVEMIMQSINLSDKLVIEKSDICDIIIDCSIPGVKSKQDNLIYKAAKLFLEKYKITSGVKFTLEKNIPVAAGLAGGSADAAAALYGLNKLFGLKKSRIELCSIAASLGSDIPFCLIGGTMLAQGRGEKITSMPSWGNGAFVIVKPPVSVSTAWVYGQYKETKIKDHPHASVMIEALKAKNLDDICKSLGNVLESVTITKFPQLAEYKSKLCRYGAKAALMSGSGPSIFAICENIAKAEKIAEKMNHEYCDMDIYVASAVSVGCSADK
ncbi:4-(cytidine 5'-diphospho)-2-C-methyl-D-erythritol kinase [Pectinatus sottacetonis]|uniref:4-(cytidine 5'-diphospho)-2-C-methyl-D-erythritol kinase n=1 Tax=Pectinatus sottacetonis TaxID=1002795 RepID=UPI0018C809AC|nr:4-(cytidine 5'-diphospho)-2-C-methyl-D-erythritol kinase [Pectinatus sottacetonis]